MSAIASGPNFELIAKGVNPLGIMPMLCDDYRRTLAGVTYLKRKVEELNASSVSHHITGSLTESDLPKQLDARALDFSNRKWIVITYNRLREQKQLHLLELPTEDLFTWHSDSDFTVHPAIEPIVKECGQPYAFRKVMQLTQLLKSGTTDHLRKSVYEEEHKIEKQRLASSKYLIEQDLKSNRAVPQVKKREVAEFPEGSFEFFGHSETEKYLKIAYEGLSKTKKWDVLKKFGASGVGRADVRSNPELKEIFDPVYNAGAHSRIMMITVVSNMLELAKNGWEALVKYHLDISKV